MDLPFILQQYLLYVQYREPLTIQRLQIVQTFILIWKNSWDYLLIQTRPEILK